MERVLDNITDVILDDEYMWIITDNLNLLLRYSFCSKELELVSEFPETMRCDAAPFSRIVKLEDEIYFIPRMAKDIFYYNVNEKKFYELNVAFDSFQNDKKMEVVIQGKFIYCINRFPDTVIKIDSVTKKTNMYIADTESKIDEFLEKNIYRAYRFLCLYNGKIIWSNYYNMLTIFDIESESFSMDILYDFPREKIEDSQIDGIELNDWIVGVKAFDDMLWLCTHKDKFYLYKNGRLQKIDNILFDRCMDSCNAANIKNGPWVIFYDIVVLKDELWFIPAYQNKCIVYNSKTKQFEEVLDDYIKNWDVNRREYSIYQVLNNNKILLYSYFENLFYIIDREDNSISNFEEIKYSCEKFIKQSKYFEQLVTRDNKYPFDDLQYLLNKVIYNGELLKRTTSENTDIGKRIFEILW